MAEKIFRIAEGWGYRAARGWALMELKENLSLAQTMKENGRKCVEKIESIDAVGLKVKEIFGALRINKAYS